MALSDYAQLLVDHTGNIVNGRIELPNGKAFQFYKSWIYLYDSPDAEYCCGTINGDSNVEWHGATFQTWRTKHQNGLMGVVSCGYDYDSSRKAWAGIAVYAYPNSLWNRLFGDIGSYCGISKRTARAFNKLLRKRTWELSFYHKSRMIFGKIRFVPGRFRFYRDYSIHGVDEFRKIDFTKLEYRNPGDDFIADRLGFANDIVSKPGNAKTPVLHRMLGK